MIVLYSKDIIAQKKLFLQEHFATQQYKSKYLAILYFGHDPVISVYVRNKIKFGYDVGLEARLFGQEKYYTLEDAYECIESLNKDKHCVGIIIQLPLPSYLQDYQQSLCNAIAIGKDVDAMTSAMMGKIAMGSPDAIYPAAVWASIQLLDFYNLNAIRGKQISIIGQSNLVGKPFALYCINQWAQVHSFGVDGDPEVMKEVCRNSDYIISATGVIELVTKEYVRNDKTQIIIDIGYGIKDGKAFGDVAFEQVQNLVHAITPVPGGIWPMCVCQLFENILLLTKDLSER